MARACDGAGGVQGLRYVGGKLDDVTVVVSKVPRAPAPAPPPHAHAHTHSHAHTHTRTRFVAARRAGPRQTGPHPAVTRPVSSRLGVASESGRRTKIRSRGPRGRRASAH